MTLILTLLNADTLENGESSNLRLDRHGAIIGRSPHSDWCLADPKNYISSSHCEIDYRDGAYVLIDKSTNGTFLNGSDQRMTEPRILEEGDVLSIGHYKVSVSGSATPSGGEAQDRAPTGAAAASTGAWAGWTTDPMRPVEALPEASVEWRSAASGWDARPAAAGSGWAAEVRSDAPVAADWATPTAEGASGWGASSKAARSGWDSADETAVNSRSALDERSSPRPMLGENGASDAPRRSPSWPAGETGRYGSPSVASATDDNVWGPAGARVAQSRSSGWDAIAPARTVEPVDDGLGYDGPSTPISGRGAMAQHWEPPRVDSSAAPRPAGAAVDIWDAMAKSHAVDWSRAGFDDPEPACSAVSSPVQPAGGAGQAWTALLQAACVSDELKAEPIDAATTAGVLLKRLVAGLMVMMEARVRAKAQLGAQSTLLELNGNNPIKFARSPEHVIAQLLNPPERGFMGAAEAVEDSFHDLQAHQLATFQAMQEALRATLARFSPDAIRTRAEMRGVLARILPSARHATLWETYEREFEGVAKGSDEAFMDIFAKAFKAAYETAAARMKLEVP